MNELLKVLLFHFSAFFPIKSYFRLGFKEVNAMKFILNFSTAIRLRNILRIFYLRFSTKITSKMTGKIFKAFKAQFACSGWIFTCAEENTVLPVICPESAAKLVKLYIWSSPFRKSPKKKGLFLELHPN